MGSLCGIFGAAIQNFGLITFGGKLTFFSGGASHDCQLQGPGQMTKFI